MNEPTLADTVSFRWLPKDGEGIPFTISCGPCARGTLMSCGRWFRSYIAKPTDRKLAYWYRVVARHERRCTRCRKAKWHARRRALMDSYRPVPPREQP